MALIGFEVSAADPYLPVHDNEVLEKLPRSFLSGRSELAGLQRQLAKNPADTNLAVQVAERYVKMGNQEGDPRFYGYARAAINLWWDKSSAPPEILKLRAKLKEKDHFYDAALSDLKELLNQRPRDAQAWIELANIYRVQGKYEQAWEASDRLAAFAGLVPTTLSKAPLQAVTGQAETAYESLTQLLPLAREQFPSTVPWIQTMQSQIAQSLGQDRLAEKHLQALLEANPQDNYALRAYADFLLDQGRTQEALSKLREHVADNGILLRAAIAANRCGEQALTVEWKKQLEVRFKEIRLRGSQPHGRYEARYLLELADDPHRALTIALGNWEKQKELRDSRNVLEAALAADARQAAQAVLDFIAKHGTQDVVLQKLAQELDRD